MMLKRVNDLSLSLDQLNGVKDVLYDLHENGFSLLNHLTIQHNSEIGSIATSSGSPLYAFPNLETVSLYDLSNLEHICHGSLTQESFCKLRSVEIKYCEKLVTIFPASIVRNLQNLETLIVGYCNLVEVIFEFQEPNDKISSTGKRIQLEILALDHLPKLKQIWNNPYLQGTFNFKNLKTVYVEDCPMLSYVFPSSLANDLRQVKALITIQNSPSTDPFEQKGLIPMSYCLFYMARMISSTATALLFFLAMVATVSGLNEMEVLGMAQSQVIQARNWMESSVSFKEEHMGQGAVAFRDCDRLYGDSQFRLSQMLTKESTHTRDDARKPLLEEGSKGGLLGSWEPAGSKADFTVAQDGSGSHKTIKEALDALAAMGHNRPPRAVIYVKSGVYSEKVLISEAMNNVMLLGDGIDKTVVTGDRDIASSGSTLSSSTVVEYVYI
ncbi:hypothetical protein L6164_000765 [Bauhinia variegata]|uniref:Uncharacterized protein n=1 Tax=Bauhinia variegata TaxID=167791 RepID=A0ACB9Q7I7_BAUVA|nr:hypothetical protein L6164_000765 [Bauhinia variegata]